MRTKLAAAIVVVSLLATSMAPASAIFGLSKCEKVKKELTVLEKQMTDVWGKGLGVNYEQVYFKQKQTIWEPTPPTVKMLKRIVSNDPIPKIWKLATNNPKCFTNTQNMQVKLTKNYTYENYFLYPYNRDKYKNTGECKILMENNEYSWDKNDIFSLDKKTKSILSKCTLGTVKGLGTKANYKSLFEY